MKKLLLTIVCFSLFYSVFGQTIASDKTYSDNSRGIACSTEVCRNFTDRVVASMSLSLLTDQQSTTSYCLSIFFSEVASVQEEFSIPDNATLLIRTSDEAVLQLKCGKGEGDFFGDIVRVGNMFVNMKTVGAVAPVTEEDIKHLQSGIIKIRCELNSRQIKQEFYENNFKKAKLGDYFTKAKVLLDSTAEKKTNGNITEGF